MPISDAAIEHYQSLRPTDFGVLERLEIRKSTVSGVNNVCVDVELRANLETDGRRLTLSFAGVVDLKLTPPGTSRLHFSYIEVLSIRDRQWEGRNYMVFETEQDADFSFLCRDFTAKLAP